MHDQASANDAESTEVHLVFNEPTRVHVTPLFVLLQWLPVSSHIKFKTLILGLDRDKFLKYYFNVMSHFHLNSSLYLYD